MGYRHPDAPPPDEPVLIDETGTKSIINIDNGVITFLAIPCFRIHGQIVSRMDMMRIDHMGWPSPGHPDRSFQPFLSDQECEIDLADMGFTDVEVILADDAPAGLGIDWFIDYNIVRLIVTAMCADAMTEDVDVPFAIYITGETPVDPDIEVPPGTIVTGIPLRSLLTKGTLHIVAGLISNEGD